MLHKLTDVSLKLSQVTGGIFLCKLEYAEYFVIVLELSGCFAVILE